MCEPLNARSLLTPAKCLPRVQQRGAGQPATAGPAQRHLTAQKTMTSSESRAAEGRLAPSDAGLLAAEDSGSTSPLRRLARPPARLHELCAPRGGVRLVPHGAHRRPVQALPAATTAPTPPGCASVRGDTRRSWPVRRMEPAVGAPFVAGNHPQLEEWLCACACRSSRPDLHEHRQLLRLDLRHMRRR